MEKDQTETLDTRVPLDRGYALTVRIGKEKKRLCVRRQISSGRECLVYVAESMNAGGTGRELVLKEFYPPDLSVRRRKDSLAAPRATRAWFQARLQRFLEGKSAYSALYAVDSQPFGYGTANGTAYAVTDPGQGNVLRLLEKDETLSQVLRCIRDLAEDLQVLHANGLVYLAFRPEHVYVTHMGKAHLMDVDQAAAVGEMPERVPVFPGYAPPEQERGERERLSPASDVYALGALLFARLTGRTPEAEERKAIREGTFPCEDKMPLLAGRKEWILPICELLSACLAEDPADRSLSASEMAEKLDALLKQLPGEAAVPQAARASAAGIASNEVGEPDPKTKRTRKRHTVLALMVLVLFAMNLAVFFGPDGWLRPLEKPAAYVRGLLGGSVPTAAPTPAGGRYLGSAAWQDMTFRVDQKAGSDTVVLRYEVGETACIIGRSATATAVTDAGAFVAPFMSAGRSLAPGTVGTELLQFPDLEGTLEYLILYGMIPLNPDGKTAAQDATSVTLNIAYLPEGGGES